ncbi:hypothetical protein PENSOL_c003G06273 [Penicillium solitum]|uniref:Uncharacterized protein n=1 Tax=Penicillium solitum TaxID=60172 RepID=A0A1V6RKQ7_9EURO|nr:uncharacterized protein PENSOL_c003G06273 [Penicillium solitum]OQE02130.1 hypothetical protein PENSOL_c003G06273 [Penicillium solitum]
MAPIHLGILVYDYQAIDVVGPVDLLHSTNSAFLEVSKIFGPINDDAISGARLWVVDENIWTGAGAVAGMDMVACWLKEQFGLEILTCAARNLDYEPRGIDGVSLVIPRRYDENGKQISTHEFFYHSIVDAEFQRINSLHSKYT